MAIMSAHRSFCPELEERAGLVRVGMLYMCMGVPVTVVMCRVVTHATVSVDVIVIVVLLIGR